MAITPLQSRIEEILSGNTNKTPHLSRIEFLLVDLIEFIQTGMSSVFHYKGSVATYADLQNVSNPAVGDVYNVQADGMDYAWDGTTWDNLGSIITIATEITADGQSPVTSEAIYNALALKADTTALANTATSISAIGTCDTAGNVAEKVVTMPQGWTLKTGSIIGVLFNNTNSVSNVALNVGGSGAKNIKVSNAIYVGGSTKYCGNANYTIYYMYDGTSWGWISNGSYPVAITQDEVDAGTSTAEKLISASLLEYAFNTKSMCLGAGNVITGNDFETDLNNYTILGVYSTEKGTSSFQHVPDGATRPGFRLTVMMDHPNNKCQIYDEFWTEKRWIRNCTTGGVWGNWVLVDTDMSVIKGINASDSNYIELKSGVRLYITDMTPTGTIPAGSVGIGF